MRKSWTVHSRGVVGQNPVPPMTPKSLLTWANHSQKVPVGFDPLPCYPGFAEGSFFNSWPTRRPFGDYFFSRLLTLILFVMLRVWRIQRVLKTFCSSVNFANRKLFFGGLRFGHFFVWSILKAVHKPVYLVDVFFEVNFRGSLLHPLMFLIWNVLHDWYGLRFHRCRFVSFLVLRCWLQHGHVVSPQLMPLK